MPRRQTDSYRQTEKDTDTQFDTPIASVLGEIITLHVRWTQVLSRTTEDEPYGWWPARIKMMKGEFAVVDYVGYESTYSDILALDNVRHTNTKYVRLCGRVCGCGLVCCCHYCELCVKCSVMTLQCVNKCHHTVRLCVYLLFTSLLCLSQRR